MLVLLGAYIIDIFAGDPEDFPHPVRLIGKLIAKIEYFLYSEDNKEKQLLMGMITTILVVAISYIITFFVVYASYLVHEGWGTLISIVIAYTTLATKSLGQEGKKIYTTLNTGDITKARKQLSYIVSRDTHDLSQEEIVRGTVETISENISDGIIAPIFYLAIGGPPLAMAYKAINTLDSMVGYKNKRYIYFGRASAKLDDIVNYIPARLSVVFISIGSFLMGYGFTKAMKLAILQGRNHSSPNSGFPEAAVAGALMIQLGGASRYFGEVIHKPTIGVNKNPLKPKVILQTTKLMYIASFVGLLFFMAFKMLIGGI
ncbi:cobalamin biosynthesis protein CobD [Alkaliphilus pronyensis]|uniref:Cobalamin biosynthesis protein CobD n=1 Tax=Alkaliphilus pronyensis TaxID=1482732 RepID=A0A6I0F9G6_9FIRM|nr:adenosylcobinamide-phosphate synthase CbiB [Alkaliphilus pronyensis]KAB3532900.1 cobalamin biosynthesis protein CobD [Alkaliphilus pronyensis]